MRRRPGRWPPRPARSDAPAAVIAVLAVVALLLSACAAPPAAPDPPPSPTAAQPADFAGPVAIGDDRELYATCRGEGSPTVVLVSGTGGGADEWMFAVPPDGAGGAPERSEASVFDQVAQHTRVCAYDRPGTTDFAGTMSSSTPVLQPASAFDAADDLAALLEAAGEHGPLVLAGASWGGLVAQALAREHPEKVAGLVLVDSASMFLHEHFTPEQWASWMAVIAASDTGDGTERPDYETTRTRWPDEDAPRMPTVVLSSDREWDLAVTPGASTWGAWLAAQQALADSLGARHVSETDSGHGIAVERPALVIDAILSVVDQVRESP